MGGTPCDKGSTSKWVLPPNSNGWQRLNGSHQWEMAETLLCLGKKVTWLSLSFSKKTFYISFTFFFFLQVIMSQEKKIVTCYHEYVMKKYEVLAQCHSDSKSSSKV